MITDYKRNQNTKMKKIHQLLIKSQAEIHQVMFLESEDQLTNLEKSWDIGKK